MKQNLTNDYSRYFFRLLYSSILGLIVLTPIPVLLEHQQWLNIAIRLFFFVLQLWWILGVTPPVLHLLSYLILWKFLLFNPLYALAVYLPMLITHHDRYTLLYLTQGEDNFWRLKNFKELLFLGWVAFYGLGVILGGWNYWPLVISIVMLLPLEFWSWLRKLWYQPSDVLEIYYDGGCTFCKRGCEILLHLYLDKNTTMIKPCQSDAQIESLMREKNSWVVKYRGQLLVKNQAIEVVFRHSALLWPIGWMIGLPGMRFVMNSFYDWLSHHRKVGANFLHYMVELNTRQS